MPLGSPGTHTSFLTPSETTAIKLQIFLDECSIEVFANDGEAVVSDLIFPGKESDGMEMFTIGGESRVTSLTIHQLADVDERIANSGRSSDE